MAFVPVRGTEVLFSVWDTRVQDYQIFANGTGRTWRRPNFAQGPTHPAVNVSWYDAKAFCVWLTEREREDGNLTTTQSYRLPQDEEWSLAVGLKEGQVGTPTRGAGNYSQVPEKLDDYEFTLPVGSFTANALGIYDMGGNLWEWCEDLIPDGVERMLRGASWNYAYAEVGWSSYRLYGHPSYGRDYIGIRVCAGEAGCHAGLSPAGRIGLFTTESCVREEAVRPNPKARRRLNCPVATTVHLIQ